MTSVSLVVASVKTSGSFTLPYNDNSRKLWFAVEEVRVNYNTIFVVYLPTRVGTSGFAGGGAQVTLSHASPAFFVVFLMRNYSRKAN